jgi:hypothetical protein
VDLYTPNFSDDRIELRVLPESQCHSCLREVNSLMAHRDASIDREWDKKGWWEAAIGERQL